MEGMMGFQCAIPGAIARIGIIRATRRTTSGTGRWAWGGVVSLLCCGMIFGIIAIVLGLQAQAAADQGLAKNRGMGTAGIICGVIGFVGALIVVLAQVQM